MDLDGPPFAGWPWVRCPGLLAGIVSRTLGVSHRLARHLASRDDVFLLERGTLMKRRHALGFWAVALISLHAFQNDSAAQGKSLKDQLVGTWIYVSSTAKRDDGTNVPRPSLQGALTYTAEGRFHFITVRTDAPKYASNDPTRPSPEEAMAIASGVVAYTGTYTLDESTKTAHLNIETSSVPNLVGAPNQRRIVTSITDEELKITNPRTPAGLTLELVFKRAK